MKMFQAGNLFGKLKTFSLPKNKFLMMQMFSQSELKLFDVYFDLAYIACIVYLHLEMLSYLGCGSIADHM